MRIASLQFFSFRNLADVEVDTSARDIFLVGENGQGKTNFLEAVYFSSYASSFRNANDREIVKIGAKSLCAVIVKRISKDGGDGMTTVKVENGKKTVVIDGKKVDDRKELLSVMPCIVFCHEDIAFAAGAPENRRWFFDQTQSLYDPLYVDDLRNFRKILKTRNNVLKDSSDFAILDVLDSQLAFYGVNIMRKRAESARLFSEIFTPLYEKVADIDNIQIRYVPSWKDGTGEGRVIEFLKMKRESDIAFGATLSGPHRDRYLFTRGGVEFARNASTGQRRLLALLLRVAQSRRFSAVTAKKPILLLDDVLLELDPEKRRRFLESMPEYNQAFYTFLPEEPYERYGKAGTIVYMVADGCFVREKNSGF
ncbi:MAG: DNA replication and repair protein RecF [Treponema sp.]|jgi:DNA replication and repair protein RecF|nr:DNA replication and repair protein RecF [Treponema sp.]